MADTDPLDTQRDVAPAVPAELDVAGFDDICEIGRGGFGVVYRCVQPALDRTVAVKVLTATLDEENLARFFREQRAMGRLTGHPNIVGVLHVGTTDSGRPYIVMPYHSQDSLETRIRRDGPLEPDEALRLGVKIAGALATAHRLDIIHRDVKPGNILLTDYGEPALTDFGIAHISGGFKTATGTVTGSPAFTAPEVLEGNPPGPASDIYGLGATLFCILTGHAAFERLNGEHVVAQFLRITTQPVPDLREQGVPGDLSAVIERAMSADPGQRPPTAANFGEELRQIQFGTGIRVDEMALPVEVRSVPRESNPLCARPEESLSVSPRFGKLPLELTSFIGRRRELAEVKEKLSSSRLVTLTGIGGVGKTRLALRAAAEMLRGFGDGVCLVELGELQDASLLLDMVAAALGLRNRSPRPLADVMVESLVSRRLLLVLDNCEHLIDAAAELAEMLLRACPELRILATSREPLGTGGEAVLRVPPLTVPDPDRQPSLRGMPDYEAVNLFAERATSAVPGFQLTEDNRTTVARICHQLEGLPLPIELAAARLSALSTEQILERLTDRCKLLTVGPRGAPTRQQTLRLSIDWSYELCAAQEKLLWERLSVFAGGFELEAAEGVCGTNLTSQELLDALTSLADKSILIREQVGEVVRFRMLETLREYGREKFEQTGAYLTLQRHRDWYRRVALEAEADWISPRQLQWVARLEREQPNLREAMKFSLAAEGESDAIAGLEIAAGLLPYWLARGLLREGRHWLDRALNHSPRQPTPERIKALYAASALAGLQGDFCTERNLVAEGQALIGGMDDPSSHAHIAQADGLLAVFTGDLPRACARLHEALEVFATQGDIPQIEVGILETLGWAFELQKDTTRATECYARALEITESHGESVYRSYALWAMGVAVWRQGDLGRSTGLLQQGLQLTRVVDDPLMAATYLESLAWVAASELKAQLAGIMMGAAESLRQATGTSTVMFPHLLVHRAECEREIHRVLGEKAVEAARKKGGVMTLDEAVAFALGEQPRAPAHNPTDATKLTPREQQVAALIAEGLTNKAIAARLVISQRTAQGHVENILVKLGFTSRVQIAAWVIEQGQGSPS